MNNTTDREALRTLRTLLAGAKAARSPYKHNWPSWRRMAFQAFQTRGGE